MSAHLSKELRAKHGIRSLPIRKNDEVHVARGTYKGNDGKVTTVYRRRWVIHIERLNREKKNGLFFFFFFFFCFLFFFFCLCVFFCFCFCFVFCFVLFFFVLFCFAFVLFRFCLFGPFFFFFFFFFLRS